MSYTKEQATAWIALLSESSDMDMKLSIKRRQMLMQLKANGVPFTNIQEAVITLHKVAKVFPRTFDAKSGKTKYVSFQKYVNDGTKWANDIRRFITWVKANYVSYDKLKKDVVVSPADKKAKELKRFLSSWKCIKDTLCDTDDPAIKSHLDALDSAIKLMERK